VGAGVMQRPASGDSHDAVSVAIGERGANAPMLIRVSPAPFRIFGMRHLGIDFWG